MAEKQHSNEWYTPVKYIEAAREVMDFIYLDPASCALANETVQAMFYFTEEDDGLSRPWYGNVWLNPPFGRVNGSGASKIKMFVTKLVDEYKAGNVKQAILLAPIQANGSWFQMLWDYPICFANHRLHFNKLVNGQLEKESRESHMLGTIFVYLGHNEQKFINTFSQFGRIAKAIDTPRHEVAPIPLWEVAPERMYAS